MTSTLWVPLSLPLRAWLPVEALKWAALLGVVLLSSGCTLLTPRPGGSAMEGGRTFSSLRGAAAPVPPLGALSALASTAQGLGEGSADEVARAGPAPRERPSCGGQSAPLDWPDFSSSSDELLAPFLTCTSPSEFVVLQDRVDMPRLVETLDDWGAVRLGTLGPVREDAAHLLQRKRASFLVSATERYGLLHAEVFALFILHSAYDDEVDEVLQLLARDKQLGQTLALMPAVHAELEQRGVTLARFPDRAEQAGDVLRGLGRAARDVLSTSQTTDGLRYTEMTARRAQLPPPYQQAGEEIERALASRHFAPDSVAVGTFDAVTFGVPLGFYYLLAGTGHGLQSLTRGEYEQATRELAPMGLLLATLSVEGKGTAPLGRVRGVGPGLTRGLEALRARVEILAEKTRQLRSQLGKGEEGLRELARYIQAHREAGRFVAAGGADAALALYEARGSVARARPLMSKARPEASGSPRPAPMQALVAERQSTLATLVDEGVGHTREVVQTKLAAAELEATGSRLPRNVGVLEKYRRSLEVPPPEAQGNPRWREYVDYYEERLREVKTGMASEGPLLWDAYERMRAWFARGLAFERAMVKRLHEDARKPRPQRGFLEDFDRPRIETQVGVKKPGPGLRYADVLVIEEGELGGLPPRVETLSFKSRDLSRLGRDALTTRIVEDASEALSHYGGKLDVRRSSLQPLLPGGSEVQVLRVRLIYEGGGLKPKSVVDLDAAVNEVQKVAPGVEVLFQ